jgi:hypothetical protein
MDPLDALLAILLVPELICGVLLGVGGAALIHWFAPKPEPILVEAGLVAVGFVIGLALSLASFKKRGGK